MCYDDEYDEKTKFVDRRDFGFGRADLVNEHSFIYYGLGILRSVP